MIKERSPKRNGAKYISNGSDVEKEALSKETSSESELSAITVLTAITAPTITTATTVDDGNHRVCTNGTKGTAKTRSKRKYDAVPVHEPFECEIPKHVAMSPPNEVEMVENPNTDKIRHNSLVITVTKMDGDRSSDDRSPPPVPSRSRKIYKLPSLRQRVRTDSITSVNSADGEDHADFNRDFDDDVSCRSVRSGYSGYSGYSNDDERDEFSEDEAEKEDVMGTMLLFPNTLKLKKSQSEYLRGLPDEDEDGYSEETTPHPIFRRSLSVPDLRRDSGDVDHGKLYQNRWGSSIPLHEGGLVGEWKKHQFFYETKGIRSKLSEKKKEKRESFRQRMKEDTEASKELEDDVIQQMITDSELEMSAAESIGMNTC